MSHFVPQTPIVYNLTESASRELAKMMFYRDKKWCVEYCRYTLDDQPEPRGEWSEALEARGCDYVIMVLDAEKDGKYVCWCFFGVIQPATFEQWDKIDGQVFPAGKYKRTTPCVEDALFLKKTLRPRLKRTSTFYFWQCEFMPLLDFK